MLKACLSAWTIDMQDKKKKKKKKNTPQHWKPNKPFNTESDWFHTLPQEVILGSWRNENWENLKSPSSERIKLTWNEKENLSILRKKLQFLQVIH